MYNTHTHRHTHNNNNNNILNAENNSTRLHSGWLPGSSAERIAMGSGATREQREGTLGFIFNA